MVTSCPILPRMIPAKNSFLKYDSRSFLLEKAGNLLESAEVAYELFEV